MNFKKDILEIIDYLVIMVIFLLFNFVSNGTAPTWSWITFITLLFITRNINKFK